MVTVGSVEFVVTDGVVTVILVGSVVGLSSLLGYRSQFTFFSMVFLILFGILKEMKREIVNGDFLNVH